MLYAINIPIGQILRLTFPAEQITHLQWIMLHFFKIEHKPVTYLSGTVAVRFSAPAPVEY